MFSFTNTTNQDLSFYRVSDAYLCQYLSAHDLKIEGNPRFLLFFGLYFIEGKRVVGEHRISQTTYSKNLRSSTFFKFLGRWKKL